MFSTVTSLPEPPVEIKTWLATWHPDPSTLHWSILDGGCFYRSPLAVWEKKYQLDMKSVAIFDELLYQDFIDRGVFTKEIFDPKLDPLQVYMAHKNPWDVLHFGILALLDDLDYRGSTWAGRAAMNLMQSYYVNEKFPYLRTGGTPSKPYGTQGRLRVAGWICHALAATGRMFRRWGVPESNHQLASLLSLLTYHHLDRILEHWPLTADPDGPNGDHLDVPHVETFMAGILREGLRKLGNLGFPTVTLEAKASDLIAAARVGPGAYVYDLRIGSDGKPLPAVATDKIITGVSGVNAWIGGDELKQDAIKQGWPIKKPSLYAQFFGGVV